MARNPHPPDPADDSFRAGLLATIPSLRGYARGLTRSLQGADDLVQETVMRALAAEAQWQPGTELRAWLFTILRHAWLGGLRRAARQRRADEAAPPPQVQAEAQTGHEALRRLDLAMARLPPTQREALLLVAAQGMSMAEAAAICGVAEGSMKARVSRGRAALRTMLGQGDSADE